MYALSVFEEDKAWFIEHRFLSTDGFGIPEQLRYAEMLHPEHIAVSP